MDGWAILLAKIICLPRQGIAKIRKLRDAKGNGG